MNGAIFKARIPNTHALNSDTHTLRIQYEYTQKQGVGVAIEGIDIWYMGLISQKFRTTRNLSVHLM